MQRLKHILLVFGAALPALCIAQVSATLSPLAKTVQVGKPFQVELSVRHPEDMVVVFPDSAKDFKPYELVTLQAKPTQTYNGKSVDAALYGLFTWDIDSVQFLQLPVRFLDAQGDTQLVMSNRAEVLFQPMIPVYSDSLQLKLHEGPADIKEPFPWLGFMVLTLILISVIGLLVFLLNKPARKFMRRYRVRRDWQLFKREYERVLPLLPKQEEYTTKLHHAWKAYIDRHNHKDLAALTTSELESALRAFAVIDNADAEVLVDLGRTRDMLLYAGIPGDEARLRDLHKQVGTIMEKEYKRRKEAAEA